VRRRFLLVIAALVLTVPLALVLWDVVRDVIVVEVWRLAWGSRILFESLPQLPLWVLLLLVLVLAAARSLGGPRRRHRREAEGQAGQQGQVQVLSRWIRNARDGGYFRWSLAQHLGGLTWQVMAHTERTTPQELRQRHRMGEVDLPPVVEDYMRSAGSFNATTSGGVWGRIRARLRVQGPSSASDQALEEVIEFLESKLELESPPDIGHPSGGSS